MDENQIGPPVLEKEPGLLKEEAKRRRLGVLLGVAVCVLTAFTHRVLLDGQLGQSALMFIGLPALMAIGLSFTPRPKTVTGAILRGMSFTMLMLGILLIEGFICILMAAPLFFVIGLVIGICADRKRVQEDMNRFRCSMVGIFLLMAMEGVVPWLSFERENVVVIEREVTGTLAEVRGRIERGPELALERLPGFFRLGFPVPEGIEREEAGEWTIRFDEGGEKPSELRVAVREEGPGRLRYVVEEDQTKISEWLTWHDGRWNLEETGEGTVRATLTVRFRRELDPAWYFGPLERYGVRKAAGYFADELLREPIDDD